MKVKIELMHLFVPLLLVGLIVPAVFVNNLITITWYLCNSTNYM